MPSAMAPLDTSNTCSATRTQRDDLSRPTIDDAVIESLAFGGDRAAADLHHDTARSGKRPTSHAVLRMLGVFELKRASISRRLSHAPSAVPQEIGLQLTLIRDIPRRLQRTPERSATLVRNRRRNSSSNALRSSSGTRSILLSTNQRGLRYSFSSYLRSSPAIDRAPRTGSSPSGGMQSTRCSNRSVLLKWRRNWWPKPAPSAAPSISPGMSAMTKLCSRTDAHDTEMRVQRRERIVRYLWPRIRDGSNQCRLAGVGQAKQSDIGEHSQLHIQLSALARLALCKLPWSAIDAGLEMQISQAAASAARQ